MSSFSLLVSVAPERVGGMRGRMHGQREWRVVVRRVPLSHISPSRLADFQSHPAHVETSSLISPPARRRCSGWGSGLTLPIGRRARRGRETSSSPPHQAVDRARTRRVNPSTSPSPPADRGALPAAAQPCVLRSVYRVRFSVFFGRRKPSAAACVYRFSSGGRLGRTGGLLAVAQGGVEDADVVLVVDPGRDVLRTRLAHHLGVDDEGGVTSGRRQHDPPSAEARGVRGALDPSQMLGTRRLDGARHRTRHGRRSDARTRSHLSLSLCLSLAPLVS